MENDENNNENRNEENKILMNNDKYKIELIEDNFMEDELIHKVILIGDSGVGKTSLSLRITKNTFEEYQKATIGFDIFKYVAKINDIIFKLQIWDTCGLEEFSSCTPSLYRDASIAIVVYAINDEKSFQNLTQWVNLVKTNSKPETLIFIVGNKSDLNKERKIKKEEGEKYKERNNFNFFVETSAKENQFVEEIFLQALIQLYEQYKNSDNSEEKRRCDFTKRKSFLCKLLF